MGAENAAVILRSASKAIAFTGAGISTASGIPDFRGPKGLWKTYPEEFASINYLSDDPRGFWEFYSTRMGSIFTAAPNLGHLALADLERLGIIKVVITQNIDGLHGLAGSRNVIELHGNMRRCYCSKCGAPYSSSEVLRMIGSGTNPPLCTCGGVIRPDVVLFGEEVKMMPKAISAANSSDCILVVGSSLTVSPANSIPYLVKQHGGRLIIVNEERTPFDEIADLVIGGAAEDVLGELVAFFMANRV
ncbi:MAG: NAD-dependent deacylase [Nitrososphaerota archaeon]|nr:NAD-dependent deacylase [Nitrososphaerota archaeon]MDG7050836.1 NAD-dependent deacylase [Nitrososphaerota archaeon]